MTETLTIAKRNQIVAEHLWCIDSAIRKNLTLMRVARLDREDVYQNLAVRLICAVELYDPDKPGGKTLEGISL